MMKKISCIIFLCLLCLLLMACDPSLYNYSLDSLLDSVVGIELIMYTNPDQRVFYSWVPDHYSRLRGLNIDNIEVLDVLGTEYFEDFLTQLSDITLLHQYYTVDSPDGICIRLIYFSGNFELIAGNYAGRYNGNGGVLDYTGAIDNTGNFGLLIDTFFTIE